MKSSLPTEKSTSCVKMTVMILGDKWTPLLISALLDGTRRFSELQESIKGLNPRTLSARLDMLKELGIINKKIYAVTPPKVEYSLTQKGIDLYPVLQKMESWGQKYSKTVN
jgi:DNA-binding HxlR family transcriptional regulator